MFSYVKGLVLGENGTALTADATVCSQKPNANASLDDDWHIVEESKRSCSDVSCSSPEKVLTACPSTDDWHEVRHEVVDDDDEYESIGESMAADKDSTVSGDSGAPVGDACNKQSTFSEAVKSTSTMSNTVQPTKKSTSETDTAINTSAPPYLSGENCADKGNYESFLGDPDDWFDRKHSGAVHYQSKRVHAAADPATQHRIAKREKQRQEEKERQKLRQAGQLPPSNRQQRKAQRKAAILSTKKSTKSKKSQ